MKYKQIIFDIDGTLTDTEYAILHSLQDTLQAISGTIKKPDELTFVLGITGENALKQLDIEDIPSTLALWEKNLKKYYDTIHVFEGIQDLLHALSKLDCELGIVTSKTRAEFEYDFQPFGIEKFFKTIVCADDTTEHKPSPAPLFKYMELSKSCASESIYIGDSKYDSECAKNAGVDFALAVWGNSSGKVSADYYLKKPLDLLSI